MKNCTECAQNAGRSCMTIFWRPNGKMKSSTNLFSLVSLALALGAPYASATSPDTWTPGPGWSLVWSDEFTGPTVDPNNWTFELGGTGWGNHELEQYNQASATIQNG